MTFYWDHVTFCIAIICHSQQQHAKKNNCSGKMQGFDESDGHIQQDTKCNSKQVRINSRGHVRPRIYNNYNGSDTSVTLKKRKLQDDSAPDRNVEILDKITTENDQDVRIHCVQHHENDHNKPESTGEIEGQGIEEQGVAADCEGIPEVHRNENATENIPIYQGHTMTVFTSILLVWVYAMTHSITGSQLSDLLVLINAHCLTNIPQYASIQTFKKFFEDLKSPLIKHYYCRRCLMSVTSDMNICPNTSCSKDIQRDGGMLYFVEYPIKKQLYDLFSRDSFCENLKHKSTRTKHRQGGIEDIYDGDIYKKLSTAENPMSNPNNISLTWNTDGVPVFKSSKVSIWPMYLMINELPYAERIKKSNMLFYGLWFGDMKPSINLFCGPLQDTLNELENRGIDIHFQEEKINVKVFLICGTADLPARSTCLNMTQFNGAHSCSRCLQRGQTEKIGERGHTHIFPFNADDLVGPPRTPAGSLNDALEASRQSKPVNGIKGPCFLMGLQCYDYVLSTGIDYMHCVLLGITKKLMTLWFSVSSCQQPYSLVKHLEEIDSRLLKIKPSYQLSRRPRAIGEHFKYWKASELRSWLFFYSVPVLQDIMTPVYLYHYCTLVQGIWILCQDSVLPHEIDYSYILLSYFVSMMEPLYGARYCTLNTHSLLHLPRCVKDLGPLWVYSCFAFESLNGELLKLFHGTQSVEMQIMSSINSHQILPGLIDKLPDDVRNIQLLKKYLNKSKTAIGLKIDHNVYVVGGKKRKKLLDFEKNAFAEALGFEPVLITFYDRIMLRNLLIHSENYARVKARNSYTVMFLGSNNDICFGHIKFFAVHRLSDCECVKLCTCKNDIFACIKEFENVPECVIDTLHVDYPEYLKMKLSHIHKLKFEGKVKAIEVHKILSLCIDVLYSEGIYFVCEMPNIIECD